MSARRRGLMAQKKGPKLPGEYQQCEWIALKSTQTYAYINTGVTVGPVTLIEAELEKVVAASSSGPMIVASRTNSGGLSTPFGAMSNSQSAYVCTPSYANTVMAPKQIFRFTKSKGTETSTVALLGWTSVGWIGIVRLSNIKIYSGDSLVFSALPCYRKSDGAIGIYDFVSNSFKDGLKEWQKGADVT